MAAVFPQKPGHQIPNVVTLGLLESQRLVMPTGIRPIVEEFFEKHGCSAHAVGSTTTRNAAIQIARMRGCAALVPYDAEAAAVPGLIIRQIEDEKNHDSSTVHRFKIRCFVPHRPSFSFDAWNRCSITPFKSWIDIPLLM